VVFPRDQLNRIRHYDFHKTASVTYWKQIKSFFFFKICLNSPLWPHFIQTRPTAVHLQSLFCVCVCVCVCFKYGF
jgi:hypothetical protein